jgi:dTDP-4-dehydrorhamnose 3,5-epimerase
MIFEETRLKGAYIITPELQKDERGFFARTFCAREFDQQELVTDFVQHSISYNSKKGTLRGMHYQTKPHQETKLVSCIRGCSHHVIVDLRSGSTTKNQWVSIQLPQDYFRMIYIPADFAHGFLTLEDETTILYQMSAFYYPDAARGFRWDDKVFNISWPIATPSVISQKDAAYQPYV